ncbi:MAG: CCA tRNA nucleotidyltransferase [Anaerorhabdus sp.]
MQNRPSHIALSYAASFCLQQLNDLGFEAFVVGGCVRDALLEKNIHDFDICTNATPEEIKTVFIRFNTFDVGIKYGTITVLVQHTPVEITTYRVDGSYTDHRSPSQIEFSSSLQEDCQRRDFTINALCYNPQFGILDFFNGLHDLEEKRIQCIGDAKVRFEEDALRILRALRFSAQLNFEIESATTQAMFHCLPLLEHLSKERISSEFKKIICAPHFEVVFLKFKPIFTFLFPELSKEIPHLSAIAHASSYSVRLALLLFALDNTEIKSFLNRLSLSKQERKEQLFFHLHKETPCTTKIELKELLRFKPTHPWQLVQFKELSHPSCLATGLYYQEILDNNECTTLQQLSIDGNDLLGHEFKKENFSYLLNSALTQVIREKVPNQKEELLNYLLSTKKNP